jgi:hypothetical protein
MQKKWGSPFYFLSYLSLNVNVILQAVSMKGRWGDSLIFLRIPPYFFRGRRKILQRERRNKIIKCNQFLLSDKNPPFFLILE